MKNFKFWRTALAVALALTVMLSITGGTIAWFTDSVTSNDNVIKSGTLEIKLEYENEDAETGDEKWVEVEDGSEALFDYDLWEPGYTEYKHVRISNTGTLALKYVLNLKVTPAAEEQEFDLAEVIDVYMLPGDVEVDRAAIAAATPVGTLRDLMNEEDSTAHGVLLAEQTADVIIALKMQESAGNDYQGLSVGDGIAIELLATQHTYEDDSFDNQYDAKAEFPDLGPDVWDGTVDTSWYNEEAEEFVLTTAEQLAGLAELVDGGNTFEGKTIKLGKDIDLNNYNFTPIGDVKAGKAFKGIFDGQNYTIGNVFYEDTNSSSGNLYNSLFSYTDGATIRNLKMDDILIARFGGELAAVAGLSKDTTFENITLTNSRIAGYNNSIGGIVSETEGTCTFKNVNVDDSNIVGTFWGSYDTRVGGIVGYAVDGNIVMENCTVACQIDSVNDACSNYMWYNYRRAGMLIGHVKGTENINGTTYASTNGTLTCTNVTVIYDDWANYHYCEFEKNGQGSYNPPDEYKFSRVEGTEYNGGHDVSQCQHTDVENNHNVLLVFDQLYGGDQGVKGQPVHDGVTIIYNNK